MRKKENINWEFALSFIYEQVLTMGILFGLFFYFALDRNLVVATVIGFYAMIIDLLLLSIVFRRQIFQQTASVD